MFKIGTGNARLTAANIIMVKLQTLNGQTRRFVLVLKGGDIRQCDTYDELPATVKRWMRGKRAKCYDTDEIGADTWKWYAIATEEKLIDFLRM